MREEAPAWSLGGDFLFPGRIGYHSGNEANDPNVHFAMTRSIPILLASIFVLTACASGVPSTPSPLPATAVPTQGPLPNVDWLAYHDDLGGFSVQHPLTWRQLENPGYPVAFILQIEPGTILLEKRMEINVTPNAASCAQSTYLGATGSLTVTINGIDFLKETGSGIALGNLYDWTSYSTSRGGTCITITFVLHSANPGVFATVPPPIDKAAESQIFDQMIQTFKFDP